MELKKGTDITFTVSQLTEAIRTLLENSFTSIQIKGEISNFKASAQGHLYFSLKDEGAQISAVMFRGSASALKFTPKDGMLIQARGQILDTVFDILSLCYFRQDFLPFLP